MSVTIKVDAICCNRKNYCHEGHGTLRHYREETNWGTFSCVMDIETCLASRPVIIAASTAKIPLPTGPKFPNAKPLPDLQPGHLDYFGIICALLGLNPENSGMTTIKRAVEDWIKLHTGKTPYELNDHSDPDDLQTLSASGALYENQNADEICKNLGISRDLFEKHKPKESLYQRSNRRSSNKSDPITLSASGALDDETSINEVCAALKISRELFDKHNT